MSELSAVTMTELTDTELDVVCGGFLDFGNFVTQTNNPSALNLSVLSVGGATIQTINQGNISLIGKSSRARAHARLIASRQASKSEPFLPDCGLIA